MIKITDPIDLDLDGKVTILGVGNELRGDDAAGVLVAEKLQKRLESSEVLVISAGQVPENFSSEIVEFNPDHLILLDSVDLGEIPGSIFRIDPSDISNPSLSTHSLSLKKIIDYWKENTGAKITFLGIQPKEVSFDAGLSEEVEKTVNEISDFLLKIIN